MDECRITANKNTIPNDPQSPFVTSGIRLGTPSVTTRGMTEQDMAVIGDCVADIVKNKAGALEATKKRVDALCKKYPLYKGY